MLDSNAMQDKIQQYCKSLYAANKVEEDLGLYVPAQGTNSPHSTTTFDLNTALENYLKGKSVSLLLMGESGTGKSLFGQAITQKLAKEYAPGKWIPLFISLPTIKHNNDIMKEFLRLHGFSKEDIQTLKKDYQFLIILDAYDEIQVQHNLFQLNKLDEWHAKVMFTCRGSYLANLPNYRSFFVPFLNDKAQETLYNEIYLAPFSINQIESYIKQYLTVKKPELEEEIKQRAELQKENWLESKTYLNWIEQISGLRQLVQTPFLLKITMQTMPTIVAQFQDAKTKEERFNMTQAKLYDAFVANWFGRQEERLMGLRLHPGGSLRKDYEAFAQALAKKMHSKNIKIVTFDEQSDLFGEPTGPGEWDMFFSDKPIPSDRNDPKRTERRILARKGCPLRKIGENQWSFIHASLLEYFFSVEIFRQALRDAESAMASFTVKEPPQERYFLLTSNTPAPMSAQITQVQPNQLDAQGKIQIDIGIAKKDFTTDKQIGKGGFGEVYLGKYQGAEVAIKTLKTKDIDERIMRDFMQEATMMATLQHPSIVRLFGVCLDKSDLSLVMEYLPNKSLDKLLHSDKELTWETRTNITYEIAIGMAFLHSKNVVHADLKSLNVLLDGNNKARIGDFGLAKVKIPQKPGEKSVADARGTTCWMAPELFLKGAKCTFQSDIYSFAIVMYEIASRKFPFTDIDNEHAIPTMVTGGTRPEIPKESPKAYRRLIEKCWSARSEKRPAMNDVANKIAKKLLHKKANVYEEKHHHKIDKNPSRSSSSKAPNTASSNTSNNEYLLNNASTITPIQPAAPTESKSNNSYVPNYMTRP